MNFFRKYESKKEAENGRKRFKGSIFWEIVTKFEKRHYRLSIELAVEQHRMQSKAICNSVFHDSFKIETSSKRVYKGLPNQSEADIDLKPTDDS